MAGDLTGQMVLFPELETVTAAEKAAMRGAAPVAAPAGVIALPGKATCTTAEVARMLGISRRQVYNWVGNGTLLAINSARNPVAGKGKGGGGSAVNHWRVVVHREGEFSAEKYRAFLTLDELLPQITNLTSD